MVQVEKVHYISYPNLLYTENDLPFVERKGVFDQLEQLIGIEFDRREMDNIVSLSKWDDEELFK